jgi:hypothetical protein
VGGETDKYFDGTTCADCKTADAESFGCIATRATSNDSPTNVSSISCNIVDGRELHSFTADATTRQQKCACRKGK